MTTTGTILHDVEGPVATVTVSNPARRNAMSLAMWEALAGTLEALARDDAVRVVVLTGAGDAAFVSGADISRFAEERSGEDAVAHYNAVVERTTTLLHDLPKPTIAMIRGACFGGGVGLAASCDLRVCSEDARFAIPAARLGLGYGFTGAKRLVDLVGAAVTKDMLFTARTIDAVEAAAIGLVSRVVPAADLVASVADLARTMAANAPLTIEAAKIAVHEAVSSSPDRARVETAVARCYASADYAEGRKAFAEKRPPVFTGR